MISRVYKRRYEKRHGEPGDGASPGAATARRARILAWSIAVLNLLFVAGMVAVISNVTTMAYGASALLIAVLALPILVRLHSK